MRRIEGVLPDELKSHANDDPVALAVSYPVSTYRKLVEQIAKLSFLNKDQLLFFRGQGIDHRNKAGASTQKPVALGKWQLQHYAKTFHRSQQSPTTDKYFERKMRSDFLFPDRLDVQIFAQILHWHRHGKCCMFLPDSLDEHCSEYQPGRE